MSENKNNNITNGALALSTLACGSSYLWSDKVKEQGKITLPISSSLTLNSIILLANSFFNDKKNKNKNLIRTNLALSVLHGAFGFYISWDDIKNNLGQKIDIGTCLPSSFIYNYKIIPELECDGEGTFSDNNTACSIRSEANAPINCAISPDISNFPATIWNFPYLDLKNLLSLFFTITSGFHLFYGINVGDIYTDMIDNGSNLFRWIEYSITATIMMIIIA